MCNVYFSSIIFWRPCKWLKRGELIWSSIFPRMRPDANRWGTGVCGKPQFHCPMRVISARCGDSKTERQWLSLRGVPYYISTLLCTCLSVDTMLR